MHGTHLRIIYTVIFQIHGDTYKLNCSCKLVKHVHIQGIHDDGIALVDIFTTWYLQFASGFSRKLKNTETKNILQFFDEAKEYTTCPFIGRIFFRSRWQRLIYTYFVF
jgi:hypothetical protein